MQACCCEALRVCTHGHKNGALRHTTPAPFTFSTVLPSMTTLIMALTGVGGRSGSGTAVLRGFFQKEKSGPYQERSCKGSSSGHKGRQVGSCMGSSSGQEGRQLGSCIGSSSGHKGPAERQEGEEEQGQGQQG